MKTGLRSLDVDFDREVVDGTLSERLGFLSHKYPDKLAFRAEGRELTYGALDDRAAHVAAALLDCRSGSRRPVSVLVGDAAAAITCAVGALKAGLPYVFLDPSWPRARLLLLSRIVESPVVIAEPAHMRLARGVSHPSAAVIDVDEAFSAGTDGRSFPSSQPESPAAVYFTSGSTGEPKGVVWTHRSVLHHAWSYTMDSSMTPDDRVSVVAPLAMAGSLRALFGGILSGASAHRFDINKRGLVELVDWLRDESVSIASFPISLLRQLLSTVSGDVELPRLRQVTLGGQALYRSDVDKFFARFPSRCELVYYLSASETGTIAGGRIDTTDVAGPERLSVGHAPANKRVTIVDEHGREAPQGHEGEVVVESRYLPVGYVEDYAWDRVATETTVGDGTIRRRTGDFARIGADGALEHLGRRDDLVKIRGYRVNTAEVETALLRHEHIEQAAVITHLVSGDPTLVGYIVSRDSHRVDEASLRRFLTETLPSYMVPSIFVYLDGLPMSTSGKLDRGGLRLPERASTRIEAVGVDPLEQSVIRAWCRVLGVDDVDTSGDFFELGGDSLKALRLAVELQREAARPVSASLLLEASTIREQVLVLRAGGGNASSLVPIRETGTKPPFFCVVPAAATALIFKDLAKHLEPDQPFYALEPLGWTGESLVHDTVEAIAAHYLAAIRDVCPQGPYALGGMCYGGIVAFEMALQLRKIGEEVVLLAILDTIRPPGHRRVRTKRSLSGYVRRFVEKWNRGELWRLFQAQFEGVTRHFAGPAAKNVARVYRASVNARESYSPRLYDGPITLFHSEHVTKRDLRSAWAELTTGELTVETVSGGHENDAQAFIREPQVRSLAEKLNVCLARAAASL